MKTGTTQWSRCFSGCRQSPLDPDHAGLDRWGRSDLQSFDINFHGHDVFLRHSVTSLPFYIKVSFTPNVHKASKRPFYSDNVHLSNFFVNLFSHLVFQTILCMISLEPMWDTHMSSACVVQTIGYGPPFPNKRRYR